MEQQRTSPFAILSLIFGVIALFSVITAVLPFLFGSLAIIFAVLSKGGSLKMGSGAKWGVTLSTAGILLSCVITFNTFYMLVNDEEYRNKVNSVFESTYGFTMEEYYDMLQETYETGEVPEGWEERLERMGY